MTLWRTQEFDHFPGGLKSENLYVASLMYPWAIPYVQNHQYSLDLAKILGRYVARLYPIVHCYCRCSREKAGNSLIFYPRGDTPPPFSEVFGFFWFFLTTFKLSVGYETHSVWYGIYFWWFMKTIYECRKFSLAASPCVLNYQQQNLGNWGQTAAWSHSNATHGGAQELYMLAAAWAVWETKKNLLI